MPNNLSIRAGERINATQRVRNALVNAAPGMVTDELLLKLCGSPSYGQHVRIVRRLRAEQGLEIIRHSIGRVRGYRLHSGP